MWANEMLSFKSGLVAMDQSGGDWMGLETAGSSWALCRLSPVHQSLANENRLTNVWNAWFQEPLSQVVFAGKYF